MAELAKNGQGRPGTPDRIRGCGNLDRDMKEIRRDPR
jgi:hypothetical protein